MQIPLKLKRECVERAAMLLEPEKYYGNKKMKDFVVYTPKRVVDEMLDLLPEEIWSDPNVTFIDICSKSGIFLERIYWRLYHGLRKHIPTGWKRSDHILTKQLFAFGLDEFCANNTRSVLYGAHKANSMYAYTTQFKDEEGNVKVLEYKYDGYVYGNFKDVINNEKLFMEVVRRAFGDMKFDVVIGNPPYNRGMDLDFVHMGFKLCQKYCVMVTPAKWQTAADDYIGCSSRTIDYKGFREKLVPYMSKVVFYPDSKDVFNTSQIDGITYFLLCKEKQDKCKVINKCRLIDIFNNEEVRSIQNREPLNNLGNQIVEYLKPYDVWKFPQITGKKKYKVVSSTLMATTNSDKSTIVSVGERKTVVTAPVSIVDREYKEKVNEQAIFESDNIDECRSFKSWWETKFTRFFIFINISKLSAILTDDCFRLVPAPPGKFDHIYTDEELYKAFNLPQEYIDVIEAVIKERKLEF